MLYRQRYIGHKSARGIFIQLYRAMWPRSTKHHTAESSYNHPSRRICNTLLPTGEKFMCFGRKSEAYVKMKHFVYTGPLNFVYSVCLFDDKGTLSGSISSHINHDLSSSWPNYEFLIISAPGACIIHCPTTINYAHVWHHGRDIICEYYFLTWKIALVIAIVNQWVVVVTSLWPIVLVSFLSIFS